MLLHDIERAIAATCPFDRQTCALAYMGACSPVQQWRYEHRGRSFYGSLPGSIDEALREKMSRGGRRGAASKHWRSLNFSKH